MKTTFKTYQEAEADGKEGLQPITPRKVPNGSPWEQKFSQTMTVDLIIITGDKGYKKPKTANALDLCYAAY